MFGSRSADVPDVGGLSREGLRRVVFRRIGVEFTGRSKLAGVWRYEGTDGVAAVLFVCGVDVVAY